MGVEQEHPAELGHLGVGAHVGDLDTEVAAALVDVELAHLEDAAGAVRTTVEIRKDHVVAKEFREVAVAEQELLDFVNRSGLLLKGLVSLYQREQLGLSVGLQQGLDLLDAESLDGLSLLLAQPGAVGTELREDRRPLGFRDAFRLRKVHVEDESLERGESRLPSRVDGVERQHSVLGRTGQRVGGDLLGLRSEVLLADGAHLVSRDVHSRGHGVVETDQLAAHEVVGDLVLDGLAGGEGRGGVVPVREHVGLVGLGGSLPGGVVGEGRVEGLDLLRRDARLAAAVGHGAHLLGDRGNERTQGFVIGGSLRDHPVAVELCLSENGHTVGSLVHGDLILLESEVGEDLLRGLVEFRAGLALRVDAVEFQHALPLEDGVLVLDHGGQPFGGSHDLRHAYAAVSVGINQLEGALVDRQVLGRTAEDRPEFLVEFAEMGDIFARGDAHPGHSAEGAVFPGVTFGLILCHNVMRF